MRSETESPFWLFSLSFYAHDDVAKSLIQSQDSCGLDVNVVLHILWLACQKRQLSVDDIVAIESSVELWKTDIVLPLRKIRRALKAPEEKYAGVDTIALREKIKAVELESEKLQQDFMFRLKNAEQWGSPQSDISIAADTNLLAYENILGVKLDGIARETILSGLATYQG
jgi:uncharacterized protein (TIGR02444 family)